jgi:H2-forming N5,N10-methylenetetrahydromethanopterin dehydrogenase-like enzyme
VYIHVPSSPHSHSAPTPWKLSSTCPLPSPLTHLFFSLTYTHSLASRDLTVRTLHPANAPSSPSFLPSEILANAPGGLEGVTDDAVWREAIASVMAETGRARRVRGMGWVEKGAFLEYYEKGRAR